VILPLFGCDRKAGRAALKPSKPTLTRITRQKPAAPRRWSSQQSKDMTMIKKPSFRLVVAPGFARFRLGFRALVGEAHNRTDFGDFSFERAVRGLRYQPAATRSANLYRGLLCMPRYEVRCRSVPLRNDGGPSLPKIRSAPMQRKLLISLNAELGTISAPRHAGRPFPWVLRWTPRPRPVA